jgi:hypothetical protein
MQFPDDKKSIPVQCYVTGHLKTLPLQEAYVLFWKVHFGWLLLLDWFRSGFGKSAKQGYMRRLVQKSGKRFGYNLLTRRSLPLTINDRCMLDEHDFPPSRNNFAARAARFAKVAGGFSLFEYDEVFDDGRNGVPAYRPNPDVDWLIVLKVAPDSSFKDTDVDWSLFQNPPLKR